MMARILAPIAVLLLFAAPLRAQPVRWWSDDVERALERAGTNRAGLLKALADTPSTQRKGLSFLLVNMAEQDLKSLRTDFLRDNVELAYRARNELPWGKRLPEEIFFNDVLPHANVDEARDPWRKQLFELCLPLVKDCKTPAEAAQRLNEKIFPILKVRYSTERRKPHQSPRESIEQGKASCTGLSILLANACRSVAVPARLAGTALWANKRGNHTWVEVWDGRWFYTGAAEADPRGLDRAWFGDIAAQAQADSREHAIFAVSFRRTAISFPLVWAPDRKDVFAENVTARYVQAKPPPVKPGLNPEQSRQVEQAAAGYFRASAPERSRWKFAADLDQLLSGQEDAVRAAVWKAYQSAPIHDEWKKDFEKNQVRDGQRVTPYAVKKVGKRPVKGWPLFIALHGGGGVPKKINDDQWRIMQIYYRDQPDVTGYQYLALRAPNDTWNGFYDNAMLPLTINLIRQFLLLGDVDPDRVHLMGYSHGGYGAFFIGPKIPDRFASIHSSAAAPTGGTISAKTLRNTRFTFMIGEKDTNYNRLELCRRFNDEVQQLKARDRGDFPVEMDLKKGHAHSDLPDRNKIRDMYTFARNPVPRRLSWELTDPVVRHFFWLGVPAPGPNQSLDAVLQADRLELTTRNVKEFDLNLDGRLVKPGQQLRVVLDGKAQELAVKPLFQTLCQSMLERGDPALACTCRVRLQTEKK